MAIVIPSKDASVTTFLVDDEFGDLIKYSDGWQTLGVIEEFGGTTHAADTAGMTATFVFNGTKVHVFGTVGAADPTQGPPLSSYSIDGGSATQYTAPSPNISSRSIHFFESPTLSNGQHVLTITYNGGQTYYLDYIQYSGPIQAPTTTMTTSTSATSTTSLISTSTTTTATSLPAVSGSSSTNTPVLAGAVVGAFFGGVVIALLCFFCWTRSRRKKQPYYPTLDLNEPEIFTPSIRATSLYVSGSQPVYPAVPAPGLRPSADDSSTHGLVTHTMTSDLPHPATGSNPPVYSKHREASGSY